MTDTAGLNTSSRRYEAFGLAETRANGHAFTGREWDAEARLYYYRARYYDPKLGRFISEDPTGFESGVNFFRYVANNPVRFNDPLGLQQQTPNSSTPTYNCMAWGLGVTHTWIQPCDQASGAPGSPNTIPPKFGCTAISCDDKVPCDRVKVVVFEDEGDPTNWHVMRQQCGSKWTSKNGAGPLWTGIPDPPMTFYNQHYKPKGTFSITCWSCPKGPGPVGNKPCW